jgi:hypothetical protein
MVERSDRRQEMDVRDNHKMLMTTAVIAAMVAVMAAPAQAYFADVEGGGSEISATAPTTLTLGGSPDAIDRYVANQQPTTLALGGSPDAIDRYVANQQPTTLALGGSPDAIDRYVANGTVATAQGGSSDSWFDRTWLGLGAGFSVLLAAAMAGIFFSARHRGRVALP